MSKKFVYCSHPNWESFGPRVVRCAVCRHLWYKDKQKDPPEVVIGYVINGEFKEKKPL